MSEALRAGRPAAATIPRVSAAARAQDPTAYAALRAYAVERAQAASGDIWTDYNLHDPGLTFLEAVCFALTDVVYKSDFPVADHLCDATGRVPFERQGLVPPREILASRPTTIEDWRRFLLDKVPRLRDVRVGVSADGRADLFQIALLSDDDPAAFDACGRAVRAAFREGRSLGEELGSVSAVEIEDYTLELEGAVSGPRDPADVIADIYDRSATLLAPPLITRTVEGLLGEGLTLDQVFTGPAVDRGVVEPTSLEARDELVLNALRGELLKSVRGLTDITRLSLTRDGEKSGQQNRLSWNGHLTAPRLRTPWADGPNSADVNLIVLKRGPTRVRVTADDVRASYADLRAGRKEARRPDTSGDAGVRLPRGTPRLRPPHLSVQTLLPPIYHLGRHRLAAEGPLLQSLEDGRPSAAGVAAAQAVQLKAYLALFDQIIANVATQVDHVRDLITPQGTTPGGEVAQTYWRATLSDATVPQITALYPRWTTPAQVSEQVHAPYDDSVNRRNRALDFLLSLYGEVYPQATQRQFLGYLDSVEQARALIRNKEEVLSQIGVLTRDRGAGFDYGKPLWTRSGQPDPTPGFNRRIALLLGFADSRARRLARSSVVRLPRTLSASLPRKVTDPRLPLEWPMAHADVGRDAHVGRAVPRGGPDIDADMWFELGVDRQEYRWRPIGDGPAGVLWLGREGKEGGLIRKFDSHADAVAAASELRDHMLALTAASEGLHVVEHVLLRPRQAQAARSVAPPGLRITVVLPGWTARTRRPEFRAFARETVAINCPAHVSADCLWLGRSEMRAFERRYSRWMTFLRAHEAGRAAPHLDRAARQLRRYVAAELRRQRLEEARTGGGD